jgi:predicted anti-sigma-YlaC factor YlaD
MTCDEVRELLAEHVLDTLDGPATTEVRQHLRGCASCRAEMHVLGDGLTMFARAVHDRRPPAELRDRVLTVLEEEWRDPPVVIPDAGRRGQRLAAAAVIVLVVASIGWAVAQTRRANELAEGAHSYQAILDVLGGEDFRIGSVRAAGTQPILGSVVLYDAHTEQSWGLVIVNAPGMLGRAHATLTSSEGRMMKLTDLDFDAAGNASAWITSSASLELFSHLTITKPSGMVIATAEISSA